MNLARDRARVADLVQRKFVRVLRIWPQTIVPPAITVALYFIIFGSLIGSRIGSMDGFDYMHSSRRA